MRSPGSPRRKQAPNQRSRGLSLATLKTAMVFSQHVPASPWESLSESQGEVKEDLGWASWRWGQSKNEMDVRVLGDCWRQ